MRTFCIPNTSPGAILQPNVVLNTNINSLPVNLVSTYSYSLQIVWTGTPTGTFKLQASCDPAAGAQGFPGVAVYNPVNFTDIPASSLAVTSAGTWLWNGQDQAYNWVRLVYTDASGGTSTATLTVCTVNSKSL